MSTIYKVPQNVNFICLSYINSKRFVCYITNLQYITLNSRFVDIFEKDFISGKIFRVYLVNCSIALISLAKDLCPLIPYWIEELERETESES